MLAANSSTEEACTAFMPFYEVTGLPVAMLFVHTITVTTLISHTWTMASRADLAHPVYAVIFQEMVMLSVCVLADNCLLVSAVVVRSEKLMVAYLNVARVAMLFHPVTWAVVSLLRYF